MANSPFVQPGLTHMATVYSDGTGSIAGTFTSVSSLYDTLVLDISGLIPKTALDSVVVQFGVGSTPTWASTNYSWMLSAVYDNSATTVATVNSSAVGLNLGACDSTTSTSMTSVVYIKNMQSDSKFKQANWESIVSSVSAFGAVRGGGSWHNSTTPVTAIRVAAVTGSVASGAAISLYGIMV